MKSKIKLLVIFIILMFMGIMSVRAEEYEMSSTGCYSVKEAACVYNYEDKTGLKEIISINFKENAIKDITFVNSKNQYNIYGGTISYANFCDKKTKNFGCPSKLYTYLDLQANNKRGQAYFIDASTSDDSVYPHDEITLIKDKSYKRYNPKTESSPPPPTYTVKCAFNKNDSNTGASKFQIASPSKLNYVQYTDGTYAFVDADNINSVFKINSGSLTCDEADNMCFNVDKYENDKVKEYSIGCTAVQRTSTGVQYIRTDIFNMYNDNSQNQDGTNNSSPLETPQTLKPLDPPNLAEMSCTSLFGDPGTEGTPAYYLTFAFKIARYIAIVLLVVLSILDFIESTASQDQDSVSKAINKAIKRLVLCVIIFLLPSMIEFILTLLNNRAANICINY